MSAIPTSVLPEHLRNFQYLNEKQVSALTGRCLQTLRNDRAKGRGFPYSKIGASVRYKLADILVVMEKGRIDPAARRGAM